jgi:hypothetical protein
MDVKQALDTFEHLSSTLMKFDYYSKTIFCFTGTSKQSTGLIEIVVYKGGTSDILENDYNAEMYLCDLLHDDMEVAIEKDAIYFKDN